MHRALQINEILRLVFRQLAETGSNGALRDSAVVCQEFREPALDALWRHIYGLLPLLSVLPIKVGGQSLILSPGKISDYTWARFDSYAIRIRIMTTSEEQPTLPNATSIHPSVYIRLAQVRPCILPRLNTMNVMKITAYTATELLLCLSNSVRTLRIAPGDPFSDLGDTLYNAGTALDVLSIHGPANIEELSMCIHLTPSYVDKLLCLQNLRILRVLAIAPPETTSSFLQSISALPRLEELHLLLLEGAVINRIPNDGFPALRSLRVPHSPPKFVARLLNALPLERLQEFETADRINWENVQTASELREILKNWRICLAALARHVNLKTVVLTINSSAVDDDVLEECEDIRFIDMIEPLLSIRGIEAFAVFSLADMPLSDADVYRMAAAWPRLTDINFCFPTEDDQPSFLSLQHIATHNPFLESLLISLDSSVDVPVIKPQKSHPLKEIRLGSTNIDDMPVLVQHLRSLFPNLENITSYGDDEATAIMDTYRSMAD